MSKPTPLFDVSTFHCTRHTSNKHVMVTRTVIGRGVEKIVTFCQAIGTIWHKDYVTLR